MAYNIDSITMLRVDGLRIAVEDLRALKASGERVPEGAFLRNADGHSAVDGHCNVYAFGWHGEFSGASWDFFGDDVVPALKGEAWFVVTWEGGDAIDLCHIKGGEMGIANLFNVLRALSPAKLRAVMEEVS